jgi:hypothetical protein
MRKRSFWGGFIFVVLAFGVLAYDFFQPHPAKEKLYGDFGHWLDQNVFADRELLAQRQACACLAQEVRRVEDDLFDGQMSLADAVEAIYSACLLHCPEFLDDLAIVEAGASPQERIARNILRHCQEDHLHGQRKDLLDRLESELAQMLRQRKTPLQGAQVSMA